LSDAGVVISASRIVRGETGKPREREREEEREEEREKERENARKCDRKMRV